MQPHCKQVRRVHFINQPNLLNTSWAKSKISGDFCVSYLEKASQPMAATLRPLFCLETGLIDGFLGLMRAMRAKLAALKYCTLN